MIKRNSKYYVDYDFKDSFEVKNSQVQLYFTAFVIIALIVYAHYEIIFGKEKFPTAGLNITFISFVFICYMLPLIFFYFIAFVKDDYFKIDNTGISIINQKNIRLIKWEDIKFYYYKEKAAKYGNMISLHIQTDSDEKDSTIILDISESNHPIITISSAIKYYSLEKEILFRGHLTGEDILRDLK